MDSETCNILNHYAITPDQTRRILHLNCEILEMAVSGIDNLLVLDRLCLAMEKIVPDSRASIMVLDETNSYLDVKSAPSMPDAAINVLSRLVPGPKSGSCGSSVYSNQPQYVYNTFLDPRYKRLKRFVRDFGIASSWSFPIRMAQDCPLGAFTLFSTKKRPPSEFHKCLLTTAAHLAGLIIRRGSEEISLWHMAHHDHLTNLPNRTLFHLRLNDAIARAERKKHKLALLFLDLDRFKEINDSLGHEAGDLVLKTVAKRILSCIRQEDMLSRIGGDEFILLIEGIVDSLDIQFVAEKILSTVSIPFNVQETALAISLSIGISIYPDNGKSPQVLQQNADTAMYQAKSLGSGNFVYFEHKLMQAIETRKNMISALREALKKKEFVLLYQPQYLSEDGSISTAEVLVRWQHPLLGMIPAEEFIPAAEDSGFIIELGKWIIRSACVDCNAWRAAGLPHFSLAVNLSAKQLFIGCARQFHEIVLETGFPADQIELEITESLVMNNTDEALTELHELKKLGFKLVMDDFGTGHSCLSELTCLPISKLKIDRSFIQETSSSNEMVTARTIIAMGHSLGLKVVAEGVETEKQRSYLIAEGCDLLQGYLFSRPLPVPEFERLLAGDN
ncbi:MAG: bifunctional diguanylate cyclase/phosphodiesterase [Gammaproteobacteria bacterium]